MANSDKTPKKSKKDKRESVIKISDAKFWQLLRANAGIYARTARDIVRTYGGTYTRQAVKDRAEKDPEQLADIEDENIDIAEDALQSLMRSRDARIQLKAIELFLKTKGRKRGYITGQELDMKANIVIKVDAETAKLGDAI